MFMITSIKMDGAENRATLEEAREVAKIEAKRLFDEPDAEFPNDNSVGIYDFNPNLDPSDPKSNVHLEEWTYNGRNYVVETMVVQ